MSKFRKEIHCPSSFALVDVVNGEIPGDEGLRIAHHLASCEFCAAELDFYAHHLPEAADGDIPSIPKPLRELAEALMEHETIHISRLRSLFGDLA